MENPKMKKEDVKVECPVTGEIIVNGYSLDTWQEARDYMKQILKLSDDDIEILFRE